MRKYVTNAAVLGLSRGSTFSSDDPFYAEIAKSGIIEEVKEPEDGNLPNEGLPIEKGPEPVGGVGDVSGGPEGGGKG